MILRSGVSGDFCRCPGGALLLEKVSARGGRLLGIHHLSLAQLTGGPGKSEPSKAIQIKCIGEPLQADRHDDPHRKSLDFGRSGHHCGPVAMRNWMRQSAGGRSRWVCTPVQNAKHHAGGGADFPGSR
ncbi:MAG: hypothetical protein ACLRT5_06995 [Lachnospiraceae bacterium]